MSNETIRNDEFSATQRCNIVATSFRMVTTLFQYCNAVLRIVPCNITFRQHEPILLMVKPVLFCTVKETNKDHPISDSQMES